MKYLTKIKCADLKKSAWRMLQLFSHTFKFQKMAFHHTHNTWPLWSHFILIVCLWISQYFKIHNHTISISLKRSEFTCQNLLRRLKGIWDNLKSDKIHHLITQYKNKRNYGRQPHLDALTRHSCEKEWGQLRKRKKVKFENNRGQHQF